MTLAKGGGAVSPPKIQDSTKNTKINLTSNEIEFTTNNILQGTLDNNGNFVLGTSSGSSGIEVIRSTASTDFGLKLQNNANGDIKITMATAAQNYSLGIDNSDNDILKLSTSSVDVGTNVLLSVTSAGEVTLTNFINLHADPTSSTHAANKNYVDTEITNAITANNELGELINVTDSSTSSGFFLYSTGAETWATAQAGSTSGIQAHDDVLDDLSGLSVVSADQLIYGTGAGTFGYSTLTSFGRSLIDDSDASTARSTLGLVIGTDVQVWDTDLDALSGLSTTGIIVRTATGSATTRSLVESTTSAITVTNGDGVSGNPSISINTGLDSIAGLTTAADKMIYTTALDTYDVTDLTSLARSLLADSTESAMRDTLQLNAGQAGDIWVEKSGDTMTGFLTLSANPTANLHAVTKQYADSIASGLDPKASAKASTTANLSGYSAVGGTGASGAFTNIDTTSFDGHVTANGDRILVQDQTDAKQNGIYIITTLNATTGAMERASDHDGSPTNEVSGGNTIFIENGTTHSGRTYVLQGDGNLILNVDDLNWQLLSNAQDWTWGVGLTNTGNTVDLTADLTDLQDVSTTSLATGNLLFSNDGTNWLNSSSVNLNSAGTKLAIGTSDFSGFANLNLHQGGLRLTDSTTGEATGDGFQLSLDGANNVNFLHRESGDLIFATSTTNRLTIDDSLNGQLRVQTLGTASNPAIAINTDNIGLFLPSAGNLGFSTAGVERLRITNSGESLFSAGTSLLPGISFLNDPNTGWRNPVADNITLVVNGSDLVNYNASRVDFGSPIQIPTGTAGSPSIRFGSDQDTGVYSSESNIVRIATGGINSISFSSGFIDIFNNANLRLANGSDLEFTGTTDDAIIRGPRSIYFNIDSDNNSSTSFFEWATDRTGNSGGTRLMLLNEIGQLVLSAPYDVGSTSLILDTLVVGWNRGTANVVDGDTQRILFTQDSDTGVGNIRASINSISTDVTGAFRSSDLSFETMFNGVQSEKLRITSSGQLLLGVTSSPYTLALGSSFTLGWAGEGILNTDSRMYFNIDSDNNSSTSFFEWATNRTGTSGGTLLMQLNEGGTLQVLANTDNLITTGTSDTTDNKSLALCGGGDFNSNRGAYLHVYGNEHASQPGNLFLIAGNIANSELRLNNTSSTGIITFNTVSTEKSRFTAAGEFLIGTTSAEGIGGAGIADENSVEIGRGYINLFRDDTSTVKQVLFGKNGSEVGSIETTGTTTAYNTSSDRRLKENFRPIENSKEIVLSLKPSVYEWKLTGETDIGLPAQDTYEVYPYAVSKGDDLEEVSKYWSIDYSKLTPVITSALQDVIQEAQEQKTRADIAEDRVSKLEERLLRLEKLLENDNK